MSALLLIWCNSLLQAGQPLALLAHRMPDHLVHTKWLELASHNDMFLWLLLCQDILLILAGMPGNEARSRWVLLCLRPIFWHGDLIISMSRTITGSFRLWDLVFTGSSCASFLCLSPAVYRQVSRWRQLLTEFLQGQALVLGHLLPSRRPMQQPSQLLVQALPMAMMLACKLAPYPGQR